MFVNSIKIFLSSLIDFGQTSDKFFPGSLYELIY